METATEQQKDVRFWDSLQSKLLLIFMGLSLVPLAVVGWILFTESQSMLQNRIEESFNTNIDLQMIAIEQWFMERKDDVVSLAGMAEVKSMNSDQAGRVIQRYFDQWGIYQNIFVLTPDGERLFDTSGATSNLADRGYFKQAMMGQTVASDALISRVSGKPIIVFATPVVVDGRVVGVVGGVVQTTYITTLLELSRFGYTGDAYLVNQNKYFITSSRFTEELKQAGVIEVHSELELQADTYGVRQALSDHEGVSRYVDYRDQEVIGSYRYLEEQKWALIVEQDVKEAFAAVNRLRRFLFSVAAVAVVLVVGLAIFFSRSIARPVMLVAACADRLSEGDAELNDMNWQNIEELRRRRDELGMMWRAFDALITYFREMAAAAQRIAGGNVGEEMQPHSEADLLGHAFADMEAYLQRMADAADSLSLGDLTVDVLPQSPQDRLGNAFALMLAYQQAMAAAADSLAVGDVSVNIEPQSVQDRLGNAFVQMIAYQQAMVDAAARLADGDLEATVEPKSERDRLGMAFLQMLTNLRGLVGQVQGGAGQVALASQQITAATEQTASGTSQVASTMQQIAQGAAEQTDSVTHAIEIVDQVSRAIDGVAQGAQEQAHSVARSAEITSEISKAIEQVTLGAQNGAKGTAQAAQAARDSAETVEATIRGMQSIKQKVDVSAAKVREMGHRSEEIGEIVATIDDIASQTNLLALNAAIEAARAGEHGRGFSVVADEVRKLAENSAQATREIAQLVKDIQQTVTEAVTAMNEGAREVDVGVTRAEDSERALREIVRIVEASGQQANEVASAAEQMRSLAEEMTSAMDEVSAVVEENTASTEEMAAGAGTVSQVVENVASISEENSAATEEVSAIIEEVSAQAEQVTASAESLNAMAEELQALVAQFKLPQG